MIRHLIFFLSLFAVRALAQDGVVDSLERQLSLYNTRDTIRVNLANALSYQYQWLDFNRSLKYAEDALEVAEAVNFPAGIATACFRLAHCYWALGDTDRSIEKALRAVSIAEQHGLTNILAETYRILAMSYRDQQEIDKAVSYIRKAESLALSKNNWDLLARIYNLAGVIDYTRRYDDSALAYYNKSLEVTEQHPTTKHHVSQVLSNIGEIYMEHQPDKALEYFTTALASAIETRNRSAETGILADIGRAHIQKKNYTAADQYLQQSLKLSRGLGLKRVSRHVYLALVDLNVRQGKTSDAFNYMKAYYDVRDSLLNGSKTRQIVELETRFEKEKQEQKIAFLEQEQRIQRLRTYVLVVGSALLIATLVIIYRLQRLRSAKDRQLLETQQALNEKLRETDVMKSRFFANISHEFRTPLALILGPLEEQLRSNKLSKDERKDLAVVQRNANRLLTLVNQLLDLSKLDAGKMELSIRKGNLSSFFHLLAASFDSLATHRQIMFYKTIAVGETPVGYDADKIEKIVNNLLFNAFKFTPPGGQVTFTVHTVMENNKVVLSIADTGKGIPVDEQSNIFTPFYQLKNDREDGEPGTGLGLSLVNELTRLYGGTLKLESVPDKGTRIEVTLPLYEAGNLEEELSTVNQRPQIERFISLATYAGSDHTTDKGEETETILVVEDNAELRDFIASGFRGSFQVLTATDGEEGLSMAMEHIPDIIISDIMMPRMNGLDFTLLIKRNERTSHIPVILLTAKADGQSRIEGLKKGADDYLAKPFSMEELQVRVANLVELRKQLAARFKEEFSAEKSPVSEPVEPSMDEKFMMKVRSVIEENIGNSFFSVEILAAGVNLSRAQLFRKVKALINTSPSELINDIRLQRAAQLIRAKADNVAQIGYAVGFNEQSYFAKRFRKKYGVSPSEYA